MTALRPALVCALAVLLLTPQAAVAGGWWSHIHVSRSTVAPGQRVEVKATVTFSSDAAAEEAREAGRYHVYLLRGFDESALERAMRVPDPRHWWSLGGAEAIPVGQVAVHVWKSGLGRARATFTVPELAPATYHVMLCDAACAAPLAEVIPTQGFTVVADPATAQMAHRLNGLQRRIRGQADRVAAARAEADGARAAARSARRAVERLETRVSSLASEARRPPPVSRWAYAGWLVAVALAGGLAVLLVSRRSPPAGATEWRSASAADRAREANHQGNGRAVVELLPAAQRLPGPEVDSEAEHGA